MIDWSWSLLDEAERAVLRRCAVHPGSLSLDAAEAICADGPDAAGPDAAGPTVVERSEVVDVLLGLVDRSMVTTVDSPAGVRYGLLESIATYAAEKLDAAGERASAARRHLDHYLGFARGADAGLRGPEQRRWLVRCEAERTQVRHAFDEAVRAGDGRSAVALVAASFWYQWMAGRQGHLLGDLDAAIRLPGPRDDDHAAAVTTYAVCMSLEAEPGREARRVEEALARFAADGTPRARARWFAGASLLSVGVRADGERHVDEAIGTLLALGEDWDAAVAASQRDWFLVSNWGDPPRGLPDGRDPETVLRAVDEGYGLAQVYAVEYRAAEVRGDHGRAAAVAERALAVCLDLELWAEASWWYVAAAMSALRSGDLSAATACLDRARALAADVAYEYGLDFAAFAESMIARYQGDFARARALLDHWTVRDGTAAREPGALFEDGFLAVWEGRVDHAEEVLRSLYGPIRRAAVPESTARLLELAAAIRAARADCQAAAELLGTADAVRAGADAGASRPDHRDIDRVRALVERQLPAERVAAALSRGRALDPEARLDALAPAVSGDARRA